jgi:hypothetical protein
LLLPRLDFDDLPPERPLLRELPPRDLLLRDLLLRDLPRPDREELELDLLPPREPPDDFALRELAPPLREPPPDFPRELLDLELPALRLPDLPRDAEPPPLDFEPRELPPREPPELERLAPPDLVEELDREPPDAPEDFLSPPLLRVPDEPREDSPPLEPEPTALPAIAPRTPPTTAPTGPATLPMTAPVAAPAACLEIGGI